MSVVFVRGAGDVGTVVGVLLHALGYKLIYTELPKPTTLRWAVSFSEAIYRGEWEVEGVVARRAPSPAEAKRLVEEGFVAVLAPEGEALREIAPEILIDARMAKRNLGTSISEAPLVVGLGPGFTAGVDCHAVVETLEGPDLGRVYLLGSALPPTHRPCAVEGLRVERVVRAPCSGVFFPRCTIGDLVKEGEPIARVDGTELLAPISGVVRGVLHEGLEVRPGMKVLEIDPRPDPTLPFKIATRSLKIAEGVVEAISLLRGRAKPL
ncbi:EF2563 family selenium-dependent molybdenum hydroxylase system protein [Candidatus Bipolaricaulota bacterium]|nr:EF2563 family selenium-dependent molybdenum hydroxylase system protein [Candidatus Bipolaricaulota bacterium]